MAAGDFVDIRRLVADLAAHRFVLLGERHDNPDHHRLQARLVRALLAAGRRPAIAFEMLDASQVPALASHLAAAPGDAAGLGAAVGWERAGWPPWSQYRPIAEAALAAGLPLAAANLARDDARAVAQHGLGALAPGQVAELGLASPIPPAVRGAIATEIEEAHCGQAPAERVALMVEAQWARDAHMARRLLEAAAGADGAVLIAGAGHVRRDRGVPAHLVRLGAAPAAVASLAFLEVRDGADRPAAYADRFDGDRLPLDYAWFTPRVDDVDPCQKFRRPLERLRRGGGSAGRARPGSAVPIC